MMLPAGVASSCALEVRHVHAMKRRSHTQRCFQVANCATVAMSHGPWISLHSVARKHKKETGEGDVKQEHGSEGSSAASSARTLVRKHDTHERNGRGA
jgi:hypothetical protein